MIVVDIINCIEVIFIKIQAEGEEKISVTLTKTDLNDFDITYDELDYDNIETRRVIWTILDEAKRVLGKPVSLDNRLLIQVSPHEDGGCFLQFTRLPECTDHKKKRLIMKKEAEPILFCSSDINAFQDTVKIINGLTANVKSIEFYKYEKLYCTVIVPKIGFSDKFMFILSEFGDCSVASKKDLAQIYEYGKKLSS